MILPKNIIGVGKALNQNGKLIYNGTLPDESKQNEPLVCLKKSDLEMLLSEAQFQMFQTKLIMNKEFFEQRAELGSIFPDELHWRTGKKEKDNYSGVTKLYLDRHWYTFDPSKSVWIRYESIDEAEQEGEI